MSMKALKKVGMDVRSATIGGVLALGVHVEASSGNYNNALIDAGLAVFFSYPAVDDLSDYLAKRMKDKNQKEL